MQSPPISQAEIDARIHDHIDELLALWWAEQGAHRLHRSRPVPYLDLPSRQSEAPHTRNARRERSDG